MKKSSEKKRKRGKSAKIRKPNECHANGSAEAERMLSE